MIIPIAAEHCREPSALSLARPHRTADAAGCVAVVAVICAMLAGFNVIDHDLFHEMATFRAALSLGRVPTEELFAYSDTVSPCVHHEWGTGMVLYVCAMTLGQGGIVLLKYLLAGAMGALIVVCARRRGAGLRAICMLMPLGAAMASVGFSPVRAQQFTMLFAAALLIMLDSDRKGGRAWILPWLAIYLVWLNLHAGFVVGAAFIALHWIEQVLRHRRPQWHLIAIGAAMVGLVFINPYGYHYPLYVWRAITMNRPEISEWLPLWRGSNATGFQLFLVSVAVLVYTICHIGWRRMHGLPIVLACAALAVLHVRHLSLYAVAWMCYAPGWLERTEFKSLLDRVWTRRRRWVIGVSVVLSTVAIGRIGWLKPWELSLPTTFKDDPNAIVYPVGAADYLAERQFHGNVMTPFNASAYLIWRLSPGVKVSLDSRYEVAYQPQVIEEMSTFYDAGRGWRRILDRYPTDLVLVPAVAAVAKAMAGQHEWPCVYRDDAYALYARPGMRLPSVDRRGQTLCGSFP